MDSKSPVYYFPFDTFEEMCTWIGSDRCSIGTLDFLITACKDEMHRRWGILDELAAEAQELKIGY